MQVDAANHVLLAHMDPAETLQQDLIMARRRPHKLFGKLLAYRILRMLAKASPPLPPRIAARFGRSAAKRNSRRTKPLPVLVPTSAERPVPVVAAPPP